MPISVEQWNSLLVLKRDDFEFPDKMQWAAVRDLDHFAQMVGSRPQVIDDWRPYDPDNAGSRHQHGDAIDTVWQGQDPLRIKDLAFQSKLWSGIGIYLNDRNTVSFHFDQRPNRSTESPAKWGNFITHPYDVNAGQNVRADHYTTLEKIVGILEKKTLPVILFLIGSGFVLYHLLKRET